MSFLSQSLLHIYQQVTQSVTTKTVFGYDDFVTTVDNTVMVFTSDADGKNHTNRPERWIVTIPSSDQWLATIGNHWKTIATNGFGDQKPLKNHC